MATGIEVVDVEEVEGGGEENRRQSDDTLEEVGEVASGVLPED